MNFKPNILIVDDDSNNLIVLRELIKHRIKQAHVLTATGGYHAIQLAEDHDIHLAIFDIKMPGMHGFELTQLFRKKYMKNPVPVILLTAIYNDAENIIRGYNSGAIDYIAKPFNNEVLINKIRMFIELVSSREKIKYLNGILEEKLHKSAGELSDSKQSLKLLYNSSAIGFYKMSLDGEIATLNQTAQKMIGVDSDEGSNRIIERNLKILQNHHNQLNLNGESNNSLEREISFEMENGNKIHLLDSAHLLIDKSMTPKHFEGSLINITPIIENRNIFGLQKNLSYELMKAKNMHSAGQVIIRNLCAIHAIDVAGFYYLNHEESEFQLTGILGASHQFEQKVRTFPVDSEEFQILKKGKMQHFTCHKMPESAKEMFINEGIKALLIIPLMRENELLGTINLATRGYCKIPSQTVETVKSLIPFIEESLYRISFFMLQQQSNQNLINLFNSIEDYIIIFTHQGEIISANKAVEEKLGYQLSDLKGKPVAIFHPPQLRDQASRIIGEMITTEKKYCTLPIIDVNNNEIPVETLVTEGFWNGKKIMIGISRDISGRLQQEEKLKFRYDFETIMTRAGMRFLNISVEKTDNAINETLREIGEFIKADRSYIFLFDDNEGKMNNTHEWCNQGIEPQMELLQNLEMKTFSWSINNLHQNQIINYYNTHDLPDDTDGTKEILLMQDIKSIILVPIQFESKLIGFTGFDAVKEHRNFSEDTEKMLKVAAGIFANAVEHRKKSIALGNYRENLEQKVEQRTKQLTKTNQLLKNEIEQRIKTEKELLKVNIALEQSAVAVIITNPEGIIEYANPATSRITGYDLKEIKGKKPDYFRYHNNKQDVHFQIDEAVKKGQQWNGEIINRQKDGRELILKLSITPIRNQSGEIIHFIAIYEDISRQKQMEKQLIQSQKMEAVGLLAGGIAHDFNNLLQIIKVYADIIRISNSDKDIHASLRQIDAAIERGSQTVGALIKYSRKKQNDLALFNLSDAIINFLPVVKSVIPATINIKNNIEKNIVIHGDSNQMEQVIMNLLMNAKDAMQNKGSITLSLSKNIPDETTLIKNDLQYILLSVEDNGAGMDERIVQRIFDPFFSTKKVGEGNGLGLSVVAGIIENHGGHIEVKSHPGQGTRFDIFLPEYQEIDNQ
jgi:PAS domain S-box-containing protein